MKSETRTHSTSSVSTTCQSCKKDFTIEPEDFDFYKKLKVPPPTWCPHCRFIRKMTYINERALYKRNCGHCGMAIISMYHQDTGIDAWCVKCYLSDVWDARDSGREYDFSRNFFEQFTELKKATPHRTLDQNEKNGEGCEYANYCFAAKNIYLSFFTSRSENIKYSKCHLRENKDCIDCLIIQACNRGYELVRADANYNSTFLVESEQCVESHFLYDCSNCVNCCLSSNLRNKSYVLRNKQFTREEYLKAVAELKLETYSGQAKAKEEFTELAKNSIHKYARIKNSVNAVGDFIENSKNVYHSYGLVDAEDSKNIFFAVNTTKDCHDMIFTGKTEECYEYIVAGRGAYRGVLSFSCGAGSNNILYCMNSRGCSDCFGCEGLDKKQYCILNKQYTKEEYEKMVRKIQKHMDEMPYVDKLGRKYGFGECFPPELSPFAYNESLAFEEELMSKEKVLASGYRWRESESKTYTPTTEADNLPDSIKDVADKICDEIIACPNQGKPETRCTFAYKILPDELQFYRQMNLPVPRYCPNCRYHQRLVWKNPFKFYKRQCMCDLGTHDHKARCANEFETMYSPERPEKVYCKTCYQKEVY